MAGTEEIQRLCDKTRLRKALHRSIVEDDDTYAVRIDARAGRSSPADRSPASLRAIAGVAESYWGRARPRIRSLRPRPKELEND